MSGHTVSRSVYYLIFISLIVLTAITVYVAFLDLGPFSDVIALGIAVTKATLVVLFFMHVKYSNKLVWAFVSSSILFLIILLAFTMSDFITRGPFPKTGGW
jgi:cytochrome c oxidase subunit 4